MIRGHWAFRDGKLVEIERYRPAENKSAYIITDTMDATFHHGDCRVYESKSSFRKATKASGCVEIGNERPQFKEFDICERDVEADVADAFEFAEQRGRDWDPSIMTWEEFEKPFRDNK